MLVGLAGLIVLPWCVICANPPLNVALSRRKGQFHNGQVVSCVLATRRDVQVIPGPMLRDETPTEADQPQDTPTFTREIVYFPCSGVRCQAWLYRPKSVPAGSKPPVVIAAHGLGEVTAGPAIAVNCMQAELSPRPVWLNAVAWQTQGSRMDMLHQKQPL